MGERKVLNKYYPPDFDPKKIPRLRKPKNQPKKIRFMLPVRTRCNTCGNCMSEGTKFKFREEDVTGETYLGVIKIHRFYIKCSNCSAEVTIITDPKNNDYIAESGATSLYSVHKEEKEKHDETTENALESLEKKTIVSKRQIEVMAALDEMKSMKSRRASVSIELILEALSKRKKQEEEDKEEEEEVLIKSIKFGKMTRIEEEKKKEPNKRRDCGKSPIQISSVRIISKKTAKKLSIGLESLCHNYGSDSDED